MTPLQTEFYGRIGKTLLEIQLAERVLQMCLSYFMPSDSAKTVEVIEAQAEDLRKKTLGDLVVLMRKRIVVADDFDRKLTNFVNDRNALAHRFLKVDGVNLHSDEGLKKGIEFLKALSVRAVDVRKTIQGLMSAIEDAPKGDDESAHYTELAKVIFSAQ
jgi:uncharacterized protein YutE (UPF0331/DUF86 family)